MMNTLLGFACLDVGSWNYAILTPSETDQNILEGPTLERQQRQSRDDELILGNNAIHNFR